MAAELILGPEADRDLAGAYEWYEGRRTGLGEDFLSQIDAGIHTILRTPESHAFVHEKYRRALMRRFPYAIYYEYEEGTVTIYAVFHTARDPAKWRERLP